MILNRHKLNFLTLFELNYSLKCLKHIFGSNIMVSVALEREWLQMTPTGEDKE